MASRDMVGIQRFLVGRFAGNTAANYSISSPLFDGEAFRIGSGSLNFESGDVAMRSSWWPIPAVVVALVATAGIEAADPVTSDLALPAMFGDHMVLQRDIPLPVWGRGRPGEAVTVTVADRTADATVDANGYWSLRLEPLAASREPIEMRVRAASGERTFNDVLVGDVWICSGQSNMGMGIGTVPGAAEVIAAADVPGLRLFRVDQQVALEPAEDCSGSWTACTPKGVLAGGGKGFSAVAYFFGREIHEASGVPIGLVGTYVGGSRCASWMSCEALEKNPLLRPIVREFTRHVAMLPDRMRDYNERLLPEWTAIYEARQARLQADLAAWQPASAAAEAAGQEPPPRPRPGDLPRHPHQPDKDFNVPGVLFNGMVHPLIPFGIKGVIWYQGESDAYPGRDAIYRDTLTTLVTDWRGRWGQGDFPFLFVQLPNFGSKENWPVIREAQRQSLAVPATGMAVTIDVGDPQDLHPADKAPVGRRLALLARALAYGEPLVASGPTLASVEADGATMVLGFDNVGRGLVARKPGAEPDAAGEPSNFELAGADGVFHPARARIAGDRVRAESAAVPAPVRVRYAWAATPEPPVDFFNRDGLPASPFEANVGAVPGRP